MSYVWRHLKTTPALFRISFADTVAYRAELIIWVLTATLPLVMLALWESVVAGGSIAGMNRADVGRYFAASLVVRQLTGAWLVWELNQEIRSGSLSGKLLRPIHPLWCSAIWMLSALPFRILILVPMVGTLAWLRPAILVLPGWENGALFLISVSLSWALAYLVQASFGTLAFWYDRSLGMFSIWFGLWGVFSGYIAPASFFPPWAQPILKWLPFRAMLGTPVELLAGQLSGKAAMADIGIQVGWLVFFAALSSQLWRRGVKAYGAFGS